MGESIVVQTRDGLAFWPRPEVALLREEHAGRLEVLHASGELAHLAGLLQEYAGPPLAPLPGALVNPAHARLADGHLHLPGGYLLPHDGPPPAAPDLAPEPEEPLGKGGPLPSEVLWFDARKGRLAWVTRRGRVRWSGTVEEAVAAHRRLVRVDSRWINRRRLRRILGGRTLHLDDGTTMRLDRATAESVAAGLGLDNLREVPRLTDVHRAMFRLGLRDWPVELFMAEEDWLNKEFFGDLDRLLANIIWQTFRYRQRGLAEGYGRDHRGLYYVPTVTVVSRAGLLDAAEPSPRLLARLAAEYGWAAHQGLWFRFLRLLERMVMDDRLLRFGQLGFDPDRADLRGLGTARPTVLLLAEKSSLRREVEALARLFGISWIILGGQPSAFGTELLADLLLPALGGRPVRVVAFVDFDPAGWVIADSFCSQARRFGLEVEGLDFLVRPERFSPEELRRLAMPLPARGPGAATLNARWVERSGGIWGRPFGLYADFLRPIERVIQAFCELTGLSPLVA